MKAPDLKDNQLSAIILAGGDGSRLGSLTRMISGEEIPKQFCPVLAEETLLEQTLKRVSLVVPSSRTVTVLTRQHERFYQPLTFNRGDTNFAVQPTNRGTAPAILFALFRLIKLGQQGTVAIFPSDHYVSDDLKFMSHVEAAATAVAIRPARIVLLGIPADRPETQYGWIEPDSFVLVSWITTLVDLFGRALPLLYVSFAQLLSALGTAAEREAIDRLYSSIGSESFSDRLLVEFAQELSVLPVRGVAWSDLNDTRRVLDTIDHLGIWPPWLAA